MNKIIATFPTIHATSENIPGYLIRKYLNGTLLNVTYFKNVESYWVIYLKHAYEKNARELKR